MTKTMIMFSTGSLMLMTGMYISTYLSTFAIAVGTALAVAGGWFMGSSAFFLPKPAKKPNRNTQSK
ncbi:hypothetical protein KQ939_13300 [Planococcus sp. CP5-4]|uniref:hypothetical protein n=1 Tax=unclassified Planococcus (in: firmicutes) TaxID=2662419 RepID=UPI001C2492CC|nr:MULTISPECIES: hypothetical protein [unclassified Planococcus (in: firmicutes)]MBU9674501.1 hypothetical protein [Planococcus sp. CP5-4_YE]MBV0910132.1 hypothetical protein [Planococcus sp. CP5-4_UN]MBW6064661.1 hypothetical protein [Planococcus sp. CP5-4]